jgi:hypothetical protein
MTQLLSHDRKRAARIAVASGLVALVAAAGAGGAGATSATSAKTAAAIPKMCKQADITPAMARKVFGAKALIAGYGVVVSSDCPIVSPDAETPPTGCLDGGDGCLVSDVVVGRASYYSQWVADAVYYLNQSGHAHKKKFSGAGSGALLLTSKTYGGSAEPVVLFKAGTHSIQIGSGDAGQGEPTAVYKQWERLARAIHAKLG